MSTDALFTGVSGLDAYQSWINMLSNNIANTATLGYKGQTMTFADMYYQQTGAPSAPSQNSGGVDPQESGTGVKVSTVGTDWSEGGLETTGVNSNMAINGNGFFVLRNPSGTGTPVYTRDGNFNTNSNGLLYDPSTGLAVQGYMANASGNVVANGAPGNITIPLGLSEQATATGAGLKVGPSANDQVFDVAMGGNLDQSQWSQQFQDQVGATSTAGTPITISTTIYDSLGNPHQATITYTPDAAGATPATVGVVAGGTPGLVSGAVSVIPGASSNDTITITHTVGATVTVTDTLGNSETINTSSGPQSVSMGGASFTIPAAGALPVGATSFMVTAATSGLPATVDNASGQAVAAATRWQVSVSLTDGTQIQTISQPGSVAANGTVTAPTYGNGSSGVIGYAYFDANGQFINTSSIEGVTGGQSLGAADAQYLHSAGTQASVAQGNQLNVTKWGPGAGNAASAPTAGSASVATPGAIALDFAQNTSLSGTSSANVLSQNGFGAGTLTNFTIGQDGTVTGTFTNGQTKTIAQVALASFQNESGLQRVGNNDYMQTSASGLAQLGTANSGQYGSIQGGALEDSNVNLGDQFTKLIIAQRAFEANSRGISTADQDLQTLDNLRASEN